MREGNLEAPTRHPLDWISESFYNEDSLNAELERVFEICHGCRRCVSLCGAFPALFDLIDATSDGELHGVDKKAYTSVVDQCYLCDLCYLTKCPYVPPHPWNVDFPHLMLRAKAVQFKKGELSLGDRVLSDTDRLGSFAGIPIVTQSVNAINRAPAVRALAESTLGVDRRAWLPEFAPKKFKSGATRAQASVVKDGATTPGKVAVYSTCYVNYNEPGIGHDLLAVLNHNDVPYVVVSKEACCGMPLLEQGDLDGVAKKKAQNIPILAKLARSGYAIVAAIPSCTLMFKQELPLMFPDDADTLAVRDAMWDPFEYLMARHRDGLLKTDFSRPLGVVAYQIPCHLRVQKIGRKTAEVLQLIPGTTLKITERCSGHAGTFGVKKKFHDVAMKIGRPVFRAVAEAQADFFSSDCQLAGHHIEQGMAETHAPEVPLAHPLTLLRRAYGI
jgi:Fe-S oxidoreductase